METMNITTAQYVKSPMNEGNTFIRATIDGQEWSVPMIPGNRFYDAIIAQGIEIEPYVEPAKTAEEIRNERNQLLAASDWTQVADAPVDRAAWVIYRQALRDITSQTGFPQIIDWPTAP
jgi:hypothetical protein